MPPELPDPGKTVAQLEQELRALIAERGTASEIRELRKEIADLKAALKASEDARAGASGDDDDSEGFPDLG